MRRATALGSLVYCLLAIPTVATAGTESDSERARALFQEGRELAKEGKYAEACPRFEQSLALEMGIGTQFNLADCYEHTGKTQSAHALFVEVADRAGARGEKERETLARQRAAAVESAVPRLALSVQEQAKDLEIRRDGDVVPSAEWATPFALDPGPHELSASAKGKKPWTMTVDVPASGQTLLVPVPALTDAEPERAPVTVAAPPAKAKPQRKVTAAKAASDRSERSSPDRTPAWILLGVGGLGAAVATTSFILYKSRNDDARAVCPTSTDCSAAEISEHAGLVDDAKTFRTVGFVGLGVAGASLAAWAITWMSGGRGPDERARSGSIETAPLVGERGAVGATVSGRW